MITWYWSVLLAFGFTLWSVFCVLIGAAITASNRKERKPIGEVDKEWRE